MEQTSGGSISREEHDRILQDFAAQLREETRQVLEQQKAAIVKEVLSSLKHQAQIPVPVTPSSQQGEEETQPAPSPRNLTAKDFTDCPGADPQSDSELLTGTEIRPGAVTPSDLEELSRLRPSETVEALAAQAVREEGLSYPSLYRAANKPSKPVISPPPPRPASPRRSTGPLAKAGAQVIAGARVDQNRPKSVPKSLQMSPLSRPAALPAKKVGPGKKPVRSQQKKLQAGLSSPSATEHSSLTLPDEPEEPLQYEETTERLLKEAESLLGVGSSKALKAAPNEVVLREREADPDSSESLMPLDSRVGESESSQLSHSKGKGGEKAEGESQEAVEKDSEWENEVARNILNLYCVGMEAERKKKEEIHVSGLGEEGETDNKGREGDEDVVKESKEERQGRERGPKKATSPMKSRKVGILSPSGSATRFKGQVGKAWIPSHVAEDGSVVINAPAVPTPVWFAGAGSIKAVWCRLAEGEIEESNRETLATADLSCGHRLCLELRALEASNQCAKYVAVVEALLTARLRANGRSDVEAQQWRQLVVTCAAFSTRQIEGKSYTMALELLKKGEELKEHPSLPPETQEELTAFLSDTYGYYYYRRGKLNAAVQYVERASASHKARQEATHFAKCLLHLGAILSRKGQHSEALRTLQRVLEMVERNELEGPESAAQKLCMISICYNNIALEYLHLRQPELACAASQNSQRLAKMCLSYSNRWTKQLERTHLCALGSLSANKLKELKDVDESQKELFKSLSVSLYS